MFHRFKKLIIITTSLILVLLFVTVDFEFLNKTQQKLVLNNDESYLNSKHNIVNYLNNENDHLIWFVQISDLHISIFHDETRIKDFEYFINNILTLIQPKLVLASGDLTDAKNNDFTGSRQYEQEWKTYHKLINENEFLKNIPWLDVRGNHDNFDVHDRNHDSNLFRKYGAMKDKERSYMYDLFLPNRDKYSFIAIDATLDPGPRRPFNFFGNLIQKDLDLLEKYSNLSSNSNGTIWFGHFPTSTIYSAVNPRKLMKNGVAYLCGHLHTLGGLLPSMYTRHSNGLLELELADWKTNRAFRLMAFDGGLFSFKDFKLSKKSDKNNIFVLITNPKSLQFKTSHKREPLLRMIYSTYIRFLVFSKYDVISAKVFINDVPIGQAESVNSTSLYVLKWNSFFYSSGIHKMKIIIEDSAKNIEIVNHEFALDNSLKSFKILSNFILIVDQIYFTKASFYLSAFILLSILVFFRYNRSKFTVRFLSCGLVRSIFLRYLRKFALLSSINYIYWSLVLMIIYVIIGPWFVGEFLEGRLGICFLWGMLVKGVFLSADMQYISGTLHMIFFQFLLMLHLSSKIEERFINFTFQNEQPTNFNRNTSSNFFTVIKSFFIYLISNLTFIILFLISLLNIYDLYLSYSIISVLVCPFKTWLLLISFYLRYKCSNLTLKDFNELIQNSNVNQMIEKMPSKLKNRDSDVFKETYSESDESNADLKLN